VKARSMEKSAWELVRRYACESTDRLVVVAAACTACFGIGRLFYEDFFIAVLFAPIGCAVLRPYLSAKARRRRMKAAETFRQVLHAVSASLTAGKSVENAFRDAVFEPTRTFAWANDEAAIGLRRMIRLMDNGIPLEIALRDFAVRIGHDDLLQFCEVFSTCKRTGVDLTEVIRITTHLMAEKQRIQQEIAVVTARKRWESVVLSAVPFVLVGLLKTGAADYMAPLYETTAGRFVMTVCLSILGLAVAMMIKIGTIRA